MSLYTVRFQTKKVTYHFDERGQKIGTDVQWKDVVLHGLPYAAAMSYSAAHNFRMEPYYIAAPSKKSASSKGDYRGDKFVRTAPVRPAKPQMTAHERAARTGDLAAAINEA